MEKIPPFDELRIFEYIVDSSEDAIIGKSLEGIIWYWNKGAEALYEYAAEEVLGKSINVIVPVSMQSEMASIFAAIREGRSVEHYETQRISKAGRIIDVSIKVSPIHDDHGAIIGAICALDQVFDNESRGRNHAVRAQTDRNHRCATGFCVGNP